MEEEIYLSNIITDEDIANILPGSFNIIKAPCGIGKTTFMFDERILNFARAKKHVLYLIHNKVTRDFIAINHKDKARVFSDNNYNGWFDKRKRGIWTTEDDEDYVHVMCYQTFGALLRNEGIDWLDDIDLIVWDEFDDIKGYYEKEIRTIQKILPEFSREKLIALIQEGRPHSVINFVYQIKTLVLDPAKIRLIAITATPELAANYFKNYVNYILTGQLESRYDAINIIEIDDVIKSLQCGEFQPLENGKIWCYTKYVTDALRIEQAAKHANFKTVCVWSEHNPNYREKYTDEKRKVTEIIQHEHRVPDSYNFIVTTGVLGRSVDIEDITVQDWICNSDEYEDIVQSIRARFRPARQYILKSARGLINFIQNGFPVEYNEWHTLDELRELIVKYPIYTQGVNPKKITTFAAVQKEYPDKFEKRQYGRAKIVQYRIKPAE